MEFTNLPPGTEGTREVSPHETMRGRNTRPSAASHPALRATRTTPRAAPVASRPVRTNSSATPFRNRHAVDQGLRFARRWFALFVPLAFITQIWAGSRFSPGKGGGLTELLLWTVLFGAIATVLVARRAWTDPATNWVSLAATATIIGFIIGAVLAVFWFQSTGGPSTGKWFIGPATAACCAGLAVTYRAWLSGE